ncbi:hypothetical protein AAM37_gp77 [Pantoea phage vB_PagM_AAM37]|uniref:Uncharacterized protein n=1 Tax=Pantoea phage vB_PagM_AAM37 TaxID=2588093 RepID=A0A513ZYJ6_9CAUD|nr:hypothetical protein HWC22_gp77 [Pantoea phage vB_PagM_AAM37]QDH45748.1 hypothetical protein AAM37_gp77 [Pantoea phage vB_PagM_AAM37]
MITFNVKVKKMTQKKLASDVVFKRFGGFRVRGVNRRADFTATESVEVQLERNGVMITIAGPALEVDQLISIQPAKYWDGGHDPVIGQEFLSKNTGRAYEVDFPVYREGILTGCYGYSKDSKGSFFVGIADMLPGREPLTEGQQKAINDVLYMYKSNWITLEQSDDMIAIIKKSTKS